VTRADGKRPGPDRGASLEGERPMTRTTTRRPRMAAIYAPGAVRARRCTATATCAATARSARADLTDIHPITGRALPRAVWWLIETKE
jgi:hypothetical protein